MDDDSILISILKNEGPREVYFRGINYVAVTNGPLTEMQLAYLIKKAFDKDPNGEIYRNSDFDKRMETERIKALESGTPWYCDLHPDEFSREAAFRHHGITIQ
jgi:hypothetical protein